VVQRRIDIQAYACHPAGTVSTMPRVLASHARPASPRRARTAGEEYGGTAEPSWREVDWASHLRRGRFAGAEVNYVDLAPADPAVADRAPVLFVHGLGGQWQNWIQNIPRAALERRVVALDLPGFGLSPMPSEPISIPCYARVVEALAQDLGLGSVALVGNSMGGFVGADLVIDYPSRVERLVLVSAAGITTSNMYRAPVLTLGRAATALTMYTAARHRQLASRPLARHLALALVARHPSRLAPDLAWEAMIKGAGKPGFEDALRANLNFDFHERLPEIACPTLIVWGADDKLVPVRDADEFERLIPDSRKVVFEDTGHVAMLERPEAFNELLARFLAEEPGEDVDERRAEEHARAEGEAREAAVQPPTAA
jgi:pimeloyl-ACP methyl ester carboxylesterase